MALSLLVLVALPLRVLMALPLVVLVSLPLLVLMLLPLLLLMLLPLHACQSCRKSLPTFIIAKMANNNFVSSLFSPEPIEDAAHFLLHYRRI